VVLDDVQSLDPISIVVEDRDGSTRVVIVTVRRDQALDFNDADPLQEKQCEMVALDSTVDDNRASTAKQDDLTRTQTNIEEVNLHCTPP
jgi:hypothetical protein